MAVTRLLRRFLCALWLGWKVESNWTSLYLFLLYSVFNPVFSCLVFYFIWLVVTKGGSGREIFYFMFIGNAFFMLILGSLDGLSKIIHMDREYFRVLGYLCVLPGGINAYLLGRAAARTAVMTTSVAVTLLFGRLVLSVPLDLLAVRWGFLSAALALGFAAAAGVGLFMAAVALHMPMRSLDINEGVTTFLFFVSGVVFPIHLLPSPLREVCFLSPFTYFLEAVRRAVLPQVPSLGAMTAFTDWQLLGAEALIAVPLLALSLLFAACMERRARKLGLLELTTAH